LTALQRVSVLGVGVSAINMEQALAELDRWIESGAQDYVCVCTVHGVMDCQRSEELRQIFNRAGMVTPDGMPLVWLARAQYKHVRRVYGPDLMMALLSRSASTGQRHFLYGGGAGVGQRLAAKMRTRFPDVRIVGVLEPPFGSLEDLCTREAAAEINAAEPDVVWVGIGSPKQEQWMARMRPALQAPVLIGVGAAFDFHSGEVRQAPLWMQRNGLEWLFRLISDPRRLWRRYLIDNPWFVWEVVLQRLGVKRYEIGR
jgi:N-acetylglucosaminyldiphosphoundecaprenol N-acetyl-beta-D-mannosaminyltransferase